MSLSVHEIVAANLIGGGLTYGKTLTKQKIKEMYEIGESEDPVEHEMFQLEYLSASEGLKNAFLKNHNMWLRSVRGIGYQIVEPKNQVSQAINDGYSAIGKEASKMVKRMEYVDTSSFTNSENKERTDQLAKAKSLKSMIKVQRKHAFSSLEE